MHFKKWILQYGITGYAEGKIINYRKLPAHSPLIPKEWEDEGASLTQINHQDYVIVKACHLEAYIEHLQETFFKTYGGGDFESYKKVYFSDVLGLDIEAASEYRVAPNLYVTVQEAKQGLFLQEFAAFHPTWSLNPLMGVYCWEMPSGFLDELRRLYTQSLKATINQSKDVFSFVQNKRGLEKLKEEMTEGDLLPILDNIQLLAKDYSNADINLKEQDACLGYGFLLRLFAELNSDNLERNEYKACLYLAKMLQENLRNDTVFLACSLARYDRFKKRAGDTSVPPLSSDLLLRDIPDLFKRLKTNVESLLLGNNQYKQFYPDENGQSKTNNLIYATGNPFHFTISEFVKKGICLTNPDGSLQSDKPAYFEFYYVQHNLGQGCRMYDDEKKVAYGTEIRKLKAFTLNAENQLEVVDVNSPLYPAAMYQTLAELLMIDRQLALYALQAKSDRVRNEIRSLEARREQLSGDVYDKQVTYIADEENLNKLCRAAVRPGLSFRQEGGSCIAFSHGAYIDNTLGKNLTARFGKFIKDNDGLAHQKALEDRENMVEKRSDDLVFGKPFMPVDTSNYFFPPPILKGLALLRERFQTYAIIDASQGEDGTLKIQLESEIAIHDLGKKIRGAVHPELVNIAKDKDDLGNYIYYVILPKNSLLTFCQIFKINHNDLLETLPTDQRSRSFSMVALP